VQSCWPLGHGVAVLHVSSTVSQLVAQKNLLGVVGAAVVGDREGLAVVGGTEGATEDDAEDDAEGGSVCTCGVVGASVSPPVVHWFGSTVKHASVELLQVAQVFVVLKHKFAASEKLAAQTLYAVAKLLEGAAVVPVDGADVGGGQRAAFN
jgi:hypothetical protein